MSKWHCNNSPLKKLEHYCNNTANTTIITRTAEAEKLATMDSARAQYEEIIGQARGLGIAHVIKNLGMDKYNENVSDTFVQLMSILDNNQTQIVINLDSKAPLLNYD